MRVGEEATAQGRPMPTTIRARYTHWGRKYAKLGKMASWDVKLLEDNFSYFAKKNVDAKLIWQTLGDAGHEPWLYS